MPLTRISAPGHLPLAQLKALAGAVQHALVTTCRVPPDDLFQLLARFAPEQMVLDPRFGGVERSPAACVVEITFIAGRTDEQKRALFRSIADGAVAAGFRADDLVVALIENNKVDWSLGRGVAYADQAAHT